jgi:autotransporter translocation and assembly factor TamB
MRSLLKPILLTVAALAAVLVILLCAGLIWVNSGQALALLQARINAAIPGSISVARHRLALLTPALDLYDVAIRDPEGRALAGFDRFSVALGWPDLLQGEIRIRDLLLAAPWADLEVRAPHGLNLAAALTPDPQPVLDEPRRSQSAGLPFNIVAEKIRLTDGRLAFVSSDARIELETAGIDITAAGNAAAQSASLEMTADDVRFVAAGIRPLPARIRLQARLDGSRLEIPALEIDSGRTQLRLAGSAGDLLGTPQLDGEMTVHSYLEELQQVLGLAGEFDGAVSAGLNVKGALDNPDAALRLTAAPGRLAGQPLDSAELRLDLRDRQVAIDTAAIRLAGGTVSLNGSLNLRDLFPAGFLAAPGEADRLAYEFGLMVDIPDLTPWVNRAVDLSGRASGRLSLTGKGVTPASISATAALSGAGQDLLAPGMDRPTAVDLSLAAQMAQGTLTVASLDASADGFELSGDGRFQVDGQALAGNLKLTSADLSRALAVVGMPFIEGACRAVIAVDGSLSQPQFDLDLAASALKIDDYTIGSLAIQADMNPDGLLQLTRLDLQNRDSRLGGSGRLRLLPGGRVDPDYRHALELVLEQVAVADFVRAAPLAGTFDGRLTLAGSPAAMDGQLSLSGRSLVAEAARIGNLEARLRLDGPSLFVDRLHLQNQASGIDLSGRVHLLQPGTLDLDRNPEFSVSLASDYFDPAHFVDKVSGDFDIKGRLTGRLQAPSGRLTLNGGRVNLAGQALDSLAVEARLTDRTVLLDRFQAVFAPAEALEGKGWLKIDQTFDLNLNTSGIALAHIYRLQEWFPGEGDLYLDISAEGHIDNPDVDGRLRVKDLRINEVAVEDVDLAFGLHDQQATLEGNLNFDVDAAGDLRTGDFDARLVFDRTETAAYFKALGRPDLRGTLTGRAQASGNIRDAAGTSGQVNLSGLDLFFKNAPLLRSDGIVLDMADRQVSIVKFDAIVLSEGHLRLSGEANLDGRLDLSVDGRVPLTAASAFNDAFIGAGGTLGLKGTISGRTQAPQVDARLDLEKIGMTVPGLTQRLADLNGSIHLTDQRIRIDRVAGLLDTGRFTVDGTIDHAHFQPVGVDLAIAARSLPIEVPDTLALLLNGDVRVTGQDRAAAASGKIVLLEGLYYKDVRANLLQMASTATTRRRTVAPTTEPLTIPFFDTVDLNIDIQARQPFVVDNNVAQMEVSPDLRIRGALARPVISGRAQVRDGTVTFQKREFTINRGIIDFVNPFRTEAEIDIESEAVIRNWTVTLVLKGPLDNLEIQLTSVPLETEADILSLILFGRTTRELTTGGGGATRTTAQIMAEMLAGTFGEEVKTRTGVDILQVENTGGSDGDDPGGIKVTVGKHLSNRMTVKYAVETLSGETKQWAIMEYRLLERILVNGFQASNGSFGAELVYRIEFR